MFTATICNRSKNIHLLPDIHRLRYKVFKERLDWSVTTSVDMEIDNFDVIDPTFITVLKDGNKVVGCARLLPTQGPNMLRDTFACLMHGEEPPCQPKLWESSRFAVDTEEAGITLSNSLHQATTVLLAAMLEWGIVNGLSGIVTVTDVRMERILKRAGWPLQRFGEPIQIGTTRALAGFVEVSLERLAEVRRLADLAGSAFQLDPDYSRQAA